MSISISDYDAVLKDVYSSEKIFEQVYQENPLLAMMPKERQGGRRFVQSVRYAKPGGASANYGTAATNADRSKSRYEDFLMQRKKQYQRVEVDNELLYATNSPRESFKKALDEFDDGFKALGEKLSKRIYRSQSGVVGQMANSSVSTTTITLADKADAFNFQYGDVISFATGDGSGQLDSGDTTEVTNVDHEAGTLTVADTLNVKISGITTTSYIYHDGDYNDCLSGFEDWCPLGSSRATKLAATFHGATRTAGGVWLGGVYMDGTAMGGIDEILIKLVGKIGKFGGRTSHIFMNPETITDMQLLSNSKLRAESLSAKVAIPGSDIVIGFSGFKVQIGDRQVSVFGDRSCPSNRIWALQLNTWNFIHAGEPINWLGEEFTGSRLTRHPSKDAMYSDLGVYSNVGCRAPAWNGGAVIPSSTT